MELTLNNAYPWGRSLDEYRRMFALTETDHTRKIIGCGDGPACFNAQWTASGGSVVSCDPLYRFSAEAIRERIRACAPIIVEGMRRQSEHYIFSGDLASPEAVETVRLAAMNQFLDDFETGRRQGRYVNAEMPRLPFADGSFDLALCSHLVFLYSAELPFEFHLEAVREMTRVAGEVRIFPLLDMQHRRSVHLEPVIERLRAGGCIATIESVGYEFQRGANQMLRVQRKC